MIIRDVYVCIEVDMTSSALPRHVDRVVCTEQEAQQWVIDGRLIRRVSRIYEKAPMHFQSELLPPHQ